MKVLVTGGAGFIGSHVVRYLVGRQLEVVALVRDTDSGALDTRTRSAITLVRGDARDPETAARAASGCRAIVHCAALVGTDNYARYPVETMATEVDSLRAVCAAAVKQRACKVIYPSSSAVYGEGSADLPADEAVKIVAASPYAIAKRYNELFLEAQYRENKLESVALRIFNIYGPGQDQRLVIPRFIERGLKGEPLIVYGDGQHRRDFVYVDDVIEAVMRCIDDVGGCEVINVASGKVASIRHLAETIIAGTGNCSKIRYESLPPERQGIEVDCCVGSSEKLSRLVGYVPCTSLADGLRMTIDDVRARLADPSAIGRPRTA